MRDNLGIILPTSRARKTHWGKSYSRHVTKGGSWQPSPEMVSFKCVIVAEEWFEEETHSRAIWEPRLKVQDAETHDILDVYCKTSALALPAGFGIGATVTFHRATRHLSSSTTTMNIYIKIKKLHCVKSFYHSSLFSQDCLLLL